MYPSVGVAAHGVASCDSAGEGGGVSNHNPGESHCDLYLWWNCIGTSGTTPGPKIPLSSLVINEGDGGWRVNKSVSYNTTWCTEAL